MVKTLFGRTGSSAPRQKRSSWRSRPREGRLRSRRAARSWSFSTRRVVSSPRAAAPARRSTGLELGLRLPSPHWTRRRAVEVPYEALGKQRDARLPERAFRERRLRRASRRLHRRRLARAPHAARAAALTARDRALPGEDPQELIDRARREVEEIGELIDDVLFLSELETGRQVVGLGTTPIRLIAA